MVSRQLSRRAMLSGVAASTAALSGCSAFADRPEPGTDDDTAWPNHGADTAGTAHVADAAAPRTGVAERWVTQIPWVSDRPVVAEGLVLLPTAPALVAYDVGSGEEVWRYSSEEHEQPWFHSPAVQDGLVYATFRETGGAVALDPADGSVRWRASVGSVSAPPLPVADGDARRVLVGERNGRLSMLDGLGTVLWGYDLFGEVTALHARSPSLGPTVHAGTAAGEVYALYESGEEPLGLWRRKVDGKVASMVVGDGGDVFVSAWGGSLYRLQGGAHAGSSRWTSEDGGTATGGLVLADDVYGKNLGGMAAVDTRTGETAWEADGSDVDFTAAPAAAGDTLYVGRGAEVVAYRFGGGVGLGSTRIEPTRWSYELGSPAIEGLAVADGAVFAATGGNEERNARLHALEAP